MCQPSAPLPHRLAEKQQQLRQLEKVVARYGHETRFDVELELEAVRRDVAVLTRSLQSLGPKHQEQLSASTDNTPSVQASLRSQITEDLARLQQALQIVANEIVYLPEPLQAATDHMLELIQDAIAQQTTNWTAQQAAPNCSVAELRAILRAIWQFHASLHLFELREIHRRRLSLMERQQVAHQLMQPSGALQQTLEADIRTSQLAIATIKQQRRRTPHDQELLALHEQNLEWNQEIVRGQRPYAPVGLLRQIQEEKAAIATIDAQLASMRPPAQR